MSPTPCQTINTFNKQKPNIILIRQTGDLKFACGNYISPIGHHINVYMVVDKCVIPRGFYDPSKLEIDEIIKIFVERLTG